LLRVDTLGQERADLLLADDGGRLFLAVGEGALDAEHLLDGLALGPGLEEVADAGEREASVLEAADQAKAGQMVGAVLRGATAGADNRRAERATTLVGADVPGRHAGAAGKLFDRHPAGFGLTAHRVRNGTRSLHRKQRLTRPRFV
jgi:hypothetical protein